MVTNYNERTWLDWLVKMRIIIITFLLGIELAIIDLTPNNVPKRLFVSIILLWYTISLFYVVLASLWQEFRIQARLQIITDLLFATAVVHVCGGSESAFQFLFPLIIIMAAILLPRSWAYLVAALAFIFFSAVEELAYFGLIRSYAASHPHLKHVQAIILINFFAYLAIASLATRLVAKLRQVDVQLQDKSGALENLQAMHESIVNCISGGLVTTTLDGRITFANPAARKLLEREPRELVGRPMGELFLERPPEAGSSGEARYVTSTGRQKSFGVSVSQLTVPEGGAMGVVYSLDDLTEMKRLEREVRMHDRLAAVGRMAAAIAHEIRNPLSSIAGSVKVFAEVTTLNDEQRTLMGIVTRESERLNAIISDFLAYSRERAYKFESVDLVTLLEDTLTLLQNQPEVGARNGNSGIRIVRDFRAPCAETVADADAMMQVFWNICENAVRAMPGGGTLSVSLSGENSDWKIVFADSGPGLSEKQVEKIFEPFQSQFARGTGLGLAIVYQIVQAHEARISVHSAPGEGTRFTLELQRADFRARGKQARAAGGVRG